MPSAGRYPVFYYTIDDITNISREIVDKICDAIPIGTPGFQPIYADIISNNDNDIVVYTMDKIIAKHRKIFGINGKGINLNKIFEQVTNMENLSYIKAII